MSKYFHGKRVSSAHFTILSELERQGVLSYINQGRRTLAEQWVFWRIYQRDGWPIAAYPSPAAPHIKWNRQNHALDINDGTSDRVAAAYRELGVQGVVFNVAREPWHIDFLDEASLIRVAHSLRERGGLLVTLKPGTVHDDVLSLRVLLKDAGYKRPWAKVGKRRYGPKLRGYVKDFQRKHGMTADGIVGPKTWAALKRVAAKD